MKLFCKLKTPMSPLSVVYPDGFQGRKSGGTENTSFFVGTTPVALTEPEIVLAQKTIEKMQKDGVAQSLLFTGTVLIDKDDPLIKATHSQLTDYEVEKRLPLTETLENGTKVSSPYERLLRIRETEGRAKYSHLLR